MPYNQDDINFQSLYRDIREYSVRSFFCDFWAALALAFLSIPQALAYSAVVGVPPYCGIIATIFGTAIAALIGSSRHLVIGPNNTTILLVQAAIAGIIYK